MEEEILDHYKFHEMNLYFLDGVQKYSDGGRIFGPVPKAVWAKRYPNDDKNMITANTDPILVQYQGKNYLIDASMTPETQPEKLFRNEGAEGQKSYVDESLAKLDLKPEDIDIILMTHLHNDHMSGLTALKDGEIVSKFPNAKIYAEAREWYDVCHPNSRTKNTYLDFNWKPVQDQVETFEDHLSLVDGAIEMFHVGGHSRGQSVVRLHQDGDYMIQMSDLFQTVAQNNPGWVTGVDDYPMDVISSKEKWFEEGIKHNYKFFHYHDPYYTWIQYNPDGKGYADFQKRSRKPLIEWTDDLKDPAAK